MHDVSDTTNIATGNTFELETPTGKKIIEVNMPPIEPVNAIKMELESLADSVQNNTPLRVSIGDGLRALEVADLIIGKIGESGNIKV